MKLSESIKNEIIEVLTPLDPFKVILFGSYAWGQPEEGSDIDLYVVTRDEFIPKNFQEKSKVYSNISKAMDKIYDKKTD